MLRCGTEKRVWWRAFICLAVAGSIAATAARSLADPPDAGIQAQLAAGEFAPAIAAAQNVPNVQQRDAALGQVAVAQAQAGAPVAAVKTVAQVGDDNFRAHILAAVGNPVGGNGNNAQNQVDFQPLKDLITNTVAQKSWLDNGGTGTISDFPTGVYVDPNGMLRPLMREARSGDLAAMRATSQKHEGQEDVHRGSPLRMISLNRLEKQIQLNAALGQSPDEAMKYLAGLRRIQYVFVYPDMGDLVIAGPAGDWTAGPENRVVSLDTGDPVVRLDDLVVVFRHMMKSPDAYFGCRIDPRKEALQRVQGFQAKWKGRSIPSGDAARKSWCEEFRAAVGKQDIVLFGGLDPETRAARTLVEADYRMKLVGMGLEPGVPGVKSYMSLVTKPLSSIDVLRWWFTLNYDSIQTSKDHLAFNILGQGVKVESENEHLTAKGERIHTGESEPLNRQFVESFTQHYDELCAKYPIYAELRNLCDLALAASLIREEGLADKVNWHMAYFGDPQAFAVERGAAAKETDTVVNYRVLNRGVFVAQVNGGVEIRPSQLVNRQAIATETDSKLQDERPRNAAKPQAVERWWWD